MNRMPAGESGLRGVKKFIGKKINTSRAGV
jgi:hypothetical protein